ncbi:MAG: hypothetical protein LQ337_006033, partial [Flavoplaca oasis]
MLQLASGPMAYLLWIAITCTQTPVLTLDPQAGYDMFVNTVTEPNQVFENCSNSLWQRYPGSGLEDPTPGNSTLIYFGPDSDLKGPTVSEPTLLLYWNHNPQPEETRTTPGWQTGNAEDIIFFLQKNLQLSNSGMVMGEFIPLLVEGLKCFPGTPFSSREICLPRFYCLVDSILYLQYLSGGDLSARPSPQQTFSDCLADKFNITSEQETVSTWGCMIELKDQTRVRNCASEYWDLTQDWWMRLETDEQLQIAFQGGVDSQGLYWKGRSENATLSESFGRQFWNVNLKCTLSNPCQHALDCTSVGSFTANPTGTWSKPFQSQWVYLATAAFVNINQQLRNQYTELGDAIESLALDTFSIDEFFPTKSQDFDLSNSLAGLSGIFSILGGFVPVAGPFISAAGTIASGVGTFLENSVAADSDDPLAAQRIFSEKVLFFYRASLRAMDDLVSKLFAGEPIPGPGPGSFTLLDMMKDGAWVNPNTLTNVSNLNEKIRREILARSIDSLWKSRTEEQTIKMWVLFTDLSNDLNSTECAQNSTFSTGPPDSKYCADGGVYYTYNFREQKSGKGGVGWPWGADQLKPKAGIDLKWVTEASAKSYRSMKAIGQDPFHFNQTTGTSQFLTTAFTAGEGNVDLSEFAGRFPGSWTLPVCDASTWGKAWNWDYTGEDNKIRESPRTHPPCLCGPKGLETYDWAKAAGLSGFETFWHRCKYILRDEEVGFEWPEGVTFVDYPADTGNKDFK